MYSCCTCHKPMEPIDTRVGPSASGVGSDYYCPECCPVKRTVDRGGDPEAHREIEELKRKVAVLENWKRLATEAIIAVHCPRYEDGGTGELMYQHIDTMCRLVKE